MSKPTGQPAGTELVSFNLLKIEAGLGHVRVEGNCGRLFALSTIDWELLKAEIEGQLEAKRAAAGKTLIALGWTGSTQPPPWWNL